MLRRQSPSARTLPLRATTCRIAPRAPTVSMEKYSVGAVHPPARHRSRRTASQQRRKDFASGREVGAGCACGGGMSVIAHVRIGTGRLRIVAGAHMHKISVMDDRTIAILRFREAAMMPRRITAPMLCAPTAPPRWLRMLASRRDEAAAGICRAYWQRGLERAPRTPRADPVSHAQRPAETDDAGWLAAPHRPLR